MIPVKEAISSGAWIHCEYTSYPDKLIQFRSRILSFRKLNLSEVDDPQEIEIIDSNANYWLLEIEVINLTKEPLHPLYMPNELILIDQDGFKFYSSEDKHLRLNSSFAKKSRMDRFHSAALIPKIKTIGSLAFQLPDDDDALYSISMKNGFVREA